MDETVAARKPVLRRTAGCFERITCNSKDLLIRLSADGLSMKPRQPRLVLAIGLKRHEV